MIEYCFGCEDPLPCSCTAPCPGCGAKSGYKCRADCPQMAIVIASQAREDDAAKLDDWDHGLDARDLGYGE